MKKVLPYIFMLLIITSFLAPFGVGVSERQVEVKKNVVSAYGIACTGDGIPGYGNGMVPLGCDPTNPDSVAKGQVPYTAPTAVTTNGKIVDGKVILDTPAPSTNSSNSLSLPACTGWFSVSLSGCIAQTTYYLIFIPTSFIFELAGEFFDFTFFYSVQDTSYRSPFVVQGWGIVRDFVNMFFIFVLLYVAISTILGVHGFNTKSMIINVVIIGLLINFSLFVTQVMIDTSNILARVFYNSDSISVKNPDGRVDLGPNGEVSLSAALVNKINPQNLIINASQVGVLPDKAGKGDTSSNTVNANTFTLVTLLASAVNIVGFIVFLSTGLIFVSRVIGLWLACIFVPFAFFSYTVPAMEGIQLVGWKHWWPDTLKQAFLAPVFIFFMYLILRFLQTGLSLIATQKSTDGITFVIGIILPFAFIMMLLWKAKDIAKDMSGTMGQAISSGISAAAGLALGGGALGAGVLLRNSVGKTAKYVQNDNARDKDKKWSYKNLYNPAALGRFASANVAQGIHKVGLGAKIKEADESFNHKVHAEHTFDAKAEEIHGKDTKYKSLTEKEQDKVKEAVDKDEMSKKLFAGKKFKDLQRIDAQAIQAQYDAKERPITDGHGKVLRVGTEASIDPKAGEKSIASKDMAMFAKSNATIGEFVQALRKGTYDLRNIAGASAKGSGFNKAAVGTMALVASGVALGLKKGGGVDYGKGQGDFFKDLGAAVTSALSSINIKVDTGGGHAPAASGGGGGHH